MKTTNFSRIAVTAIALLFDLFAVMPVNAVTNAVSSGFDNIYIVTDVPTSGEVMNSGSVFYTSSAGDFYLNVDDLTAQLALGNVQVLTMVGDIYVQTGVEWTSPTSLTLNSGKNISVDGVAVIGNYIILNAARNVTVDSGATVKGSIIDLNALQNVEITSGAELYSDTYDMLITAGRNITLDQARLETADGLISLTATSGKYLKL